MTGFQPGEIVDITIKGVRIEDQYPDGSVRIAADTFAGAYGTWHMPPQAAVERVAPAEWPPQPGDLWRRDDTRDLYFAADVHNIDETLEPEIVMVCAYEDHRLEPEKFRHRCAGRMALVHREGDPEACGCDHHGDHAGCGADCECAS